MERMDTENPEQEERGIRKDSRKESPDRKDTDNPTIKESMLAVKRYRLHYSS
jgi:hypothetical protein